MHFTQHVRDRMLARNITQQQVMNVIANGNSFPSQEDPNKHIYRMNIGGGWRRFVIFDTSSNTVISTWDRPPG